MKNVSSVNKMLYEHRKKEQVITAGGIKEGLNVNASFSLNLKDEKCFTKQR